MTELSNTEKQRYLRHLILPEVGEKGQLKLKNASVAIVGAGGLGSPVALYLAAAGVGRLGLIDFDSVDLSNLQRQVLYAVSDVKKSKSETARDKLLALNPEIEVSSHKMRLSAANVMETLADYDLVVDGTDNFETRYLINDACVLSSKPNVYGSIFRFEGQLSVFCTTTGPCYRCLFPVPPEPDAVPNCAEGGVLGVLAGVIGTLQATEAVKLILGEGQPLIGKLLLYNALDMDFQKLAIKRKRDCPVCGEQPTITRPADLSISCANPVERASTTGGDMHGSDIDVVDVAKILKERANEILLLDVRNDNEVAFCKIEGSKHIPLNELPTRFNELDKNAETYIYCRSGARSRNAVEYLKQNGFTSLRNVRGGILEWSDKVDSTIPKY
ncbi:molybdopterin-synthase adenylyltransferase MoeB [Candidatus Obscuribacterales bacterium]|nr:molybdopterin-synthase adenylyltransferase MoeB [Candidatus Obscuribacterales bacterium]